MIVTSFQDLKLCGKEISQSFSDGVLINSPKNGAKVHCFIVFPETLSPKMTSPSFPISRFWSRGFVPRRAGSEI